MICNSCGKQNPDGSGFCSGCGNQLSAPGSSASSNPQYSAPNIPSQPYYPPPQPVAPPPYYGGSNSQYVPNRPFVGQNLTGSQPSFIQNWRAAAGSSLFLVAVLIYSLSFLITLIQIMDQSDNLSYILYRAGLRGISDTFMLFLILAMVPNVLLGIGLWLIYAEGKKPQGLPIKTTGLSMVFGVVVCQFVLICIVLINLFCVCMHCTGRSLQILSLFLLFFFGIRLFFGIRRCKCCGGNFTDRCSLGDCFLCLLNSLAEQYEKCRFPKFSQYHMCNRCGSVLLCYGRLHSAWGFDHSSLGIPIFAVFFADDSVWYCTYSI